MTSEINSPRGSQSEADETVRLAKYSIGVGDRFAHQTRPQLRACMLAAENGVEIIPVWNKSNREHVIVGSDPESVRTAAEQAVRECGWNRGFHVDADHINLETVDRFIDSSDFFTIDVAEMIGKDAGEDNVAEFVARHHGLQSVTLPDGDRLSINVESVRKIAGRYLRATEEAGRIYRKIEAAKGTGTFITEVSMDETDAPQTPEELLVILIALADQKIPLQTIAPKFSGRFNKGVDYVGDITQFEKEFRSDVAVVAWAVEHAGLPRNLKLSVHSGSDKFAIYPAIRRVLRQTDAGLHLKTAGTTWLEELIGLAEAGGSGLALAKEIYATALVNREELCSPYATVIDVNPALLPSGGEVSRWSSEEFVQALRHDPNCPRYNPNFRQLLHVAYKVAARKSNQYLQMLNQCEETISRNVTENLYDRHIRPVFID
jgi:tagaturonate epimerase